MVRSRQVEHCGPCPSHGLRPSPYRATAEKTRRKFLVFELKNALRPPVVHLRPHLAGTIFFTVQNIQTVFSFRCQCVWPGGTPFRSVVAGPPSPCRRPRLSKRGAYLGLRSEKLKQLHLRLSHSAGRAWNCSSPRSINLRVRGSWGHVL